MSDLVATERAAKIAFELALGEYMTTQQAADFMGVSYSWALRMLRQLMDVIPITFDDPQPPLERYWFATKDCKKIPLGE